MNNMMDSRKRSSSYYRPIYGKSYSTTLDLTCESPPIKRPRLPPVSYLTLMNLLTKSPDEILTEMIDPNFQLNTFLNDKRMQERVDWISSMTILLEKITQCTHLRVHIPTILEKLPKSIYLEGVYNEIQQRDPTTNQFNFKLIELFLKISNTLLAMIPHSADGFTKFFDRIEIQFAKNQFESREFEDAKEILDQVLQRTKDLEKINTTNRITTTQNYMRPPPNDYRQLSIVPNLMELLSEERPYLRKNIVDGIYENAEQYLDIHFRLLREDFIGPLRDGLRQYLSKTPDKNYNVRVYENVRSLGSRLTPYNGLVYDLQLDSKTASKIRWANSRRLIYGNLLLLTFDNFHSCVSVVVEDRSQIETNSIISVKTIKDFDKSKGNEINLNKIPASCSLTMFETMSYFEAYRPVLHALQRIPSDARFPLAPFLLKLSNVITPPGYITPTTTYDFTPLLDDPNREEKNYKSVRVLAKEQWPMSKQLHLNPKQYEALVLALTNRVALIQGPPGTGKTYLGVRITEMLLHNRSVWRPSDKQSTPILMICHTNHALDQFLELIVNRLNIQNGIVRVGSRCQNPKIQRFSLKNARQGAQGSLRNAIFFDRRKNLEAKIAIEGDIKSTQTEMRNLPHTIISLSLLMGCRFIVPRHFPLLLARFNVKMSEIALLKWLGFATRFERISDRFLPEINRQTTDVSLVETNETIDEFNEEDEEEERRRHDNDIDLEEYESPQSTRKDRKEKQTVQNQGNHSQRHIRYITETPTTLNDQTVARIQDDVWQLNREERYDLYRYWLFKYRQYLQYLIDKKSRAYSRITSTLTKHRQEEDYYLLKNNLIVAMTTTCAAKYHDVLEKLASKIVIVEEAAAIFEAHIITALSTKCEHLILIGDHVQLKPNPNVYRLGVKYQIDVSLFERLIKNRFRNVRLNIQHRMRPEIGRLMKYFYDDLEDHVSVERERPAVCGVNSNLFFINHNHLEANVDSGCSYKNEFEANYAIELAHYLIKQDYQPQQITILVMYLGQRQRIANLAKQKGILQGVRIMVTDNYQGEENDIIILSLVRSNPEKKIGFLKIHNRICVALSRARYGLFVLGNMTLLAEMDEIWKQIVVSASETNNLGRGLSLSCRQHSKEKIIADKPESFAQRPEGGCKRTCDARLPCGHRCDLVCHNYDFEHTNVPCYKQWTEQLACGHPCKKWCHIQTQNQHDQCHVVVDKIISQCGHKVRLECSRAPSISDCQISLLHRLDCGHETDVPCRIISSPSGLKQFSCREPCGTRLACGHQCVGRCGECREGKLHAAREEKCGRELISSHVCKAPCARNCPPCSRPCETHCVHSRCKKRCGEPCTPCKESCAYRCKHFQCTRLCSQPCNRGPCNEPCYQKLRCGHSCIGMCGELCPPQCRYCDKERVQEIFLGNEDEPDARFVFLPDCEHIIEVNALDQWIKKFENNPNDKTAIRFPECPRCRQKIYRCGRYTSILNRVYELISQNSFFSDDEFNLMTNILAFLREIDDILADGWNKLHKYIYDELIHGPVQHIMKYLSKQRQDRNFAEQQLNDIQWELKRIHRVVRIEALVIKFSSTLNDVEKECINSMRHLVKKSSPFTDEDRQKIDELTKKFEQIRNLPGLGINDRERIEIVRALNISEGHWFICPKGHPYVITECGGASQRSQCPECGEQIGGENHRLVQTNRHFGLMDGSQHAAYSDEANLRNFIIRN